MPTDTQILEVFLWPENGGLRWWTPAATATFRAPPPALLYPGAPETDHRRLAEWLPSDLVEHIRSASSTHLHLDPQLAEDWQRQPWEWFRLTGEPLAGRLLGIRYDNPDTSPEAATGDLAIINFWPVAEGVQPFRNLGAPGVRVIASTRDQAGEWIHYHDLTALSAMVIIAHGTEASSGFLLDEQGRHWRLPTERGLPPLVVLLACDDYSGNLLSEGRQWLSCGARAVLVPTGRLDAVQAGGFLRRLLAAWRTGSTVADILRAAQGDWEQRHGAGRLCLLGWHGLRLNMGRTPESLSETDLGVQLDTLTRRQWRNGWDLKQILGEFRNIRALPPHYADDPEIGCGLLADLKACEADLPNLTRAWVLGLMAYLAEKHDHPTLGYCARTRHRLESSLTDAPEQHHQWGKLHYRQGNYRQAMAELTAGLTLDPNHPRLLGLLANCLLDLNLPGPAEIALDQLERVIHRDPPDAEELQFNLLDRRARLYLRQGRARLYLRQGRPAAARGQYSRKYHIAREERGEDGIRELAGLLYVTAWKDRDGEDRAIEIGDTLTDPQAVATATGSGNPTQAYLLRALALWAWRRDDATAADRVACHRKLLQRCATRQDPGPFGMALAFLRLYYRNCGEVLEWLEDAWDEIGGLMEEAQYWLELAALHHLAGESNQATRRCLVRFHTWRRDALMDVRLPNWLCEDLEEILANRERLEEQVLSATIADPAALVEAGLQPL